MSPGELEDWMVHPPEKVKEDRQRETVIRLQDETDRLRSVLYRFREYVIRGATQWQMGYNHHCPIWAEMAEQLKEFPLFINRDPRTLTHEQLLEALKEGSGENP